MTEMFKLVNSIIVNVLLILVVVVVVISNLPSTLHSL